MRSITFVGKTQRHGALNVLRQFADVYSDADDAGINCTVTIEGPDISVDAAMMALEKWIDEDEED